MSEKRPKAELYLAAKKIVRQYVDEQWELYEKLGSPKLFFDCMVSELDIETSPHLLAVAEQVLAEVIKERAVLPSISKFQAELLKNIESKFDPKKGGSK